MIGGLVAAKVDPSIMSRLGLGRRTALVTGTNGKSTTTRMLAAALAGVAPVATQADGANMDAGIIATLSLTRGKPLALSMLVGGALLAAWARTGKPKAI